MLLCQTRQSTGAFKPLFFNVFWKHATRLACLAKQADIAYFVPKDYPIVLDAGEFESRTVVWLCFFHTFGVGASIRIDAHDITFVDKHRN